MKICLVIHKNEKRIKVEFPNTKESAQRIRQIADARWSATLKSWHIPYTKEAFEQLKNIFPGIEIIKSDSTAISQEITIKPIEDTAQNAESIGIKRPVSIEISGRKIILKLPKNETDIRFIMSLRYSRWDKSNFCWIVPNYPGNIELIKQFFGERIGAIEISETTTIENKSGQTRNIEKNEMLVVETAKGRLKIYFAYDKLVSKKIKDFPYCKWDKGEKCWSIPYAENYIKELRRFAEENKIKFTFEVNSKNNDSVKRLSKRGDEGYRNCPEEYILKIREIQYSERTLKTYQNAFEDFINYYKDIELDAIDDQMILEFMRYLVIERKVSESYQNQMINSIKFYYEKVLRGKRKTYLIDRPKKEKTLPTVLNEQEIRVLLKATENLKHKTILMLAYSSGLRLGELINLKIKDIDSKRMQIRVEQSKGKKDRYTILSNKMLTIMREYFSRYKPKEWLFEGEKGGQYAARSIQMIVKASVRKAGIKKKVGVHTLRHTFATHLLENGTDLRYIQEILGHKSSRTTEIYTHVSKKSIQNIASPFDDL